MDDSEEKFYFKMSDLQKNIADARSQANLTYDFTPLSTTVMIDETASDIYSKNFIVMPNTASVVVTTPDYLENRSNEPNPTTACINSSYENNFLRTIVLNNHETSLNLSNASLNNNNNNDREMNAKNDSYDASNMLSTSEHITQDRYTVNESSDACFYEAHASSRDFEDDENLCCNTSLRPEIELSIYGSETLPENSVLEAENTINTADSNKEKVPSFLATAVSNAIYEAEYCADDYVRNNNYNYNNNFGFGDHNTSR